MIKIDLITGLLGAGKTSFIKKYAEYFIKKGERISIIENDYGAVNVDRMLLQELEGEKCDIEMIIGDNDYETHTRRFRTKLISLGMLGYDRVIIEPSGIYDTDEFFDVLSEEPLNRWYKIENVIGIIDAKMDRELSSEMEYMLVSQSADCGLLLFSHKDAGEETIKATLEKLNAALKKYHCERSFSWENILPVEMHKLTEEELEQVETCGYALYDHVKIQLQSKESFESLFFYELKWTKEKAKEVCQTLLNDRRFGKIIRIKGFLQEKEKWWELNATQEKISLQPIEKGQNAIIVIGEQLEKDKINKCIYG